MSKRRAPLHVNQFVGGLNTEQSPLESSLETSKDEVNMDLNNDGSRSKRLGFDLETSYIEETTSTVLDNSKEMGSSTYTWKNAGGDPDKSLLVVQVANSITIYDLDTDPISNGKVYGQTFSSSSYSTQYSYATEGDLLVIVTGEKDVNVYEYDGSSVTTTTDTLLIRDLFGVEAYEGSTVLTDATNLEVRPTTLEDTHVYNLRNQTFAIPRQRNNTETLSDPIDDVFTDGNVYPSNSDQVNLHLYADANDTDNRLIERFFSKNLVKNPVGSSPAPKGYFIIDALERGVSRIAKEDALRSKHTELTQVGSALPADTTSGGARTIASYAGRFWYGGFSFITSDGDNKSPRMGSYLLFTQVIKDKTMIGRCYQEAAPTSPVDPNIVANDGGFIKLEGVYGIHDIRELSGSLFVFAENGVWRVSGQNGAFSADSYTTEKISDDGCISGNSVVIIDNTIVYWGETAIYMLGRNEFGIWVVTNVTKDRIKTFYRAIDIEQKKVSSGIFDDYERTVRWVYSNPYTAGVESKELVFKVDTGAFIPYTVPGNNGTYPKIINIGEANSYTSSSSLFPVTENGVQVIENGVDVEVSQTVRNTDVKEAIYVVLTSGSTNLSFTLGLYNSTNFVDFEQLGQDTSYDAYIITQDLSFGDPRARKGGSYLHTFFKRTETGFDTTVDPINPSSCLLSYRWGWSDATESNKWTTERQAYRYNKSYMPSGPGDTFETGFQLITTRNKIRGSGLAMSFKFNSEVGKNLYLYGWSFGIEASRED